MFYYTVDVNFDPSKHPRGQPENAGQFVEVHNFAGKFGVSPEQLVQGGSEHRAVNVPYDVNKKGEYKNLLSSRGFWPRSNNPNSFTHPAGHSVALGEGKLSLVLKSHGRGLSYGVGNPKQVAPVVTPKKTAPVAPKENTPVVAKKQVEVAPKQQVPSEGNDHPVEGRAGLEGDWLRKSFSAADVGMKSALAKVPPVQFVSTNSSNGCAGYQSETRQLFMPEGSDQVVFRHEFGHAMDYALGKSDQVPKSYVADAERKADGDNLVKSLAGKPTGLPSLYVVMNAKKEVSVPLMDFVRKSKIVGNIELSCLSDFMCALTNNRIGTGHSEEYFANYAGAATTEMFANYVALSCVQGRGIFYKMLMHSLAPNTCATFESIIAGKV